MSNRYCYLLASGNEFSLASSQQNLFDIYLLLYVQSLDDGRKDRPKHVECYTKIYKFEKLVYLVGFTVEIVLLYFSLCSIVTCFYKLPENVTYVAETRCSTAQIETKKNCHAGHLILVTHKLICF